MENMFWNDLSGKKITLLFLQILTKSSKRNFSKPLAGTSTGRLDNNFFARDSQIGNGALQIEGTNASRNWDMMENNFKQDLREYILYFT